MKSLILFISLFATTISGQTLVAESEYTQFYVYDETVYQTGHHLLFTGKIIKKNHVQLDIILANCQRRTYVVAKSKIDGFEHDWVTPHDPPMLQVLHNSAIYFVLEKYCQPVLNTRLRILQ